MARRNEPSPRPNADGCPAEDQAAEATLRLKNKNLRRDPRVALSILDPDNPYRYLSIRGRVIKITETGAVEHINALAKKYRGMDIYRSPRPDEVRVIYVIEPRRVAGQS